MRSACDAARILGAACSEPFAYDRAVDVATWVEELKRRRVFRALIGYGIVAFAVLQVIEPVIHGLGLPDWVLSATVVGLGIGSGVTLILAWMFDFKAGRIERTGPIPGGRTIDGDLWRDHRPAASGAAPASIAVLPFADLSPGKDLDWMCDGIAEEIIDALCTVSGLRVASRSSSFQFKGKSADVQVMTRALGVSTLLEGSVRKGENRLRVSARLVSGDGYDLWADRFDRRLEDAFAIQEEIARAVVAALRLRLSGDDGDRLRRGGTANAQAYEMYLRGRQYFRWLSSENVELARQTFKRAIVLDDSFAQAHAGLADVDINLVQWLLAPSNAQAALRAEALAASEKALKLEPDLAEAHVARANVLASLGRPDEADQSFRRAIKLSPGLRDAWYHYGRFLFSVQRHADSAQAFEEAARRDPDDYDSLTLMAMPYSKLGDERKVHSSRERALAAADRVLSNRPDDVRALYFSGGALINLGEKQKGVERLEQAVGLKPHDFATLYNAACGFALAGEAERALDLLDRAVDTGRGFRAWMEEDPDLDSLRGSPRFAQILARLQP